MSPFPHQYHWAPLKPRKSAWATIVTKKGAEVNP
jgi:hypothetical protein